MSTSIVTCEDCMELMKRYPDKYFELAIVDPPYGINYNNDRLNRPSTKKFKNIINDNNGDINYEELINKLTNISKIVVIFGALNFIKSIPYRGTWVCWDKRTHEIADGVLGSPYEMAWVNINHGYDKIIRVMHGGVVNADGKNNERIHPTQKPIRLYEKILSLYAKPGDKILDTHLGSGSSRIACDKLGFDFVGCELDKDYFEAQEKRWATYKAQLKLF